ncbi:hypothetical protein, partial [Allorhodopirellula heiligendammensis]|uniref:hypothetical protein n=1 Tax=Allorhodopirellula heiligendammensis TaxID=2714739 RepID=UPI00265F1BA7
MSKNRYTATESAAVIPTVYQAGGLHRVRYYRPRFGRTSRRFWAELLSQVAAIVTPLIRYSLARPRNPQLAT